MTLKSVKVATGHSKNKFRYGILLSGKFHSSRKYGEQKWSRIHLNDCWLNSVKQQGGVNESKITTIKVGFFTAIDFPTLKSGMNLVSFAKLERKCHI
jgi:hypothetical protein